MGVRTSDIQVNIKVRGQRIDNLFPAFDLLKFVEKKIGLSICGELRFELTGDGFLYNMVRIIVGTLIEVGAHSRAAEDMPAILASKDRERAGYTAPAQGLSLWQVRY